MAYKVKGYIIDSKKYLVKVFDFIISLEYIYIVMNMAIIKNSSLKMEIGLILL